MRTARGIDRAVMAHLIDGSWIQRHENLLITGPTGLGKSWIACALGHKACRDGRSAAYHRMPRLFEALAIARGDGRHARNGRLLLGLKQAGNERLRQSELALDQARYEAAHARRQYDAVDPDNRLVAGELERRWNDCLAAVVRLEDQVRSLRSEQPSALSEDERTMLIALADDMPALWNHPAASVETRKRILRTVLKEIIVTAETDRLHLVLHWHGGDHTRLDVVKNRSGQNRYKTDVATGRVSGFAQSGFNEVARRAKPYHHRRATSQNPPDSKHQAWKMHVVSRGLKLAAMVHRRQITGGRCGTITDDDLIQFVAP